MNSGKTAPNVEPARHWINGEWIGSSTVANSVSPSTGEVLGQYSAGGRVEAAAAITAARKAFDTSVWPHDPQLRSRALLELADRLEERADAIALTISREMAKRSVTPRSKPLGARLLFVTTQELRYRRQAHQLRLRQAYSRLPCASRLVSQESSFHGIPLSRYWSAP